MQRAAKLRKDHYSLYLQAGKFARALAQIDWKFSYVGTPIQVVEAQLGQSLQLCQVAAERRLRQGSGFGGVLMLIKGRSLRRLKFSSI